MRAIILAAGQGQRLRPLTDDRPKCMVEYQGRPLLDHVLASMRACEVTDVVVVTGYRHDVLEKRGLYCRHNAAYASTNMTASLFCAEADMTDDLIVSYSDIVYHPRVLRSLIEASGDFCVTVDLDWESLWRQRMEDPLTDAETLKLDGNLIVELGKKPQRREDIQGQYMGLFKIAAHALPPVKKFYHSLDRTRLYDGKTFENMYMTSFIQLLIDSGMPVHAVPVHGGWTEVDKPGDLNVNIALT